MEDNKVTILKNIAASDLNESTKDEAIKSFLAKPEGDEVGMLDRFFGKNHPDIYIGLMVIILLTISGMLITCTFRDDKELVKAM